MTPSIIPKIEIDSPPTPGRKKLIRTMRIVLLIILVITSYGLYQAYEHVKPMNNDCMPPRIEAPYSVQMCIISRIGYDANGTSGSDGKDYYYIKDD